MTNDEFMGCRKHALWLSTLSSRHEIPHQRAAKGVVRDSTPAVDRPGSKDLAHGASFQAGEPKSRNKVKILAPSNTLRSTRVLPMFSQRCTESTSTKSSKKSWPKT